MCEQNRDFPDAVASSTECTGAVPAIPWDGDTQAQRRLLRVHGQPRRIYRKKS